MHSDFYKLLKNNPVIAAIKNDDDMAKCCENKDIHIVYVLYGNIITITDIVNKLKEAEKFAVVHVDLIDGLATKDISADFIKKYTKADGIISTRSSILKRGKELGLYTTLRIFILDSKAIGNITKQISSFKPDVIEILPGLMPKIIKNICNLIDVPIIVGGLISEKSEIIEALAAGAICVSSSEPSVWRL